jgi:hypothetical protein
MFKAPNSTVFILGAGASWHYGYPTGEDLVEQVIQKASIAASFFKHSFNVREPRLPAYLIEGKANWEKAYEECVKLEAGLKQVKPLVIDYYLGWNSDLQNLGRLLIAWVILERESRGININRPPGDQAKDDWCRFIIHQLAIHCRESKDLLCNKISFVTFNYDISLETNLHKGLAHIQMFDEKDVATFLGGFRIIHMYGKVRDVAATAAQVDWNVQGRDPRITTDYHLTMKTLLDVVYDASKGLRVIDPHDKGTDDAEIMIARAAIAGAQRIFILGYGFDEHNSSRLDLREHLRHTAMAAQRDRRVAFTNFQDINQINKRVSNLFYDHPRAFPPGGPAVQDRYEKSVRNTYDALAMDFDLAD